MLGAEPLGIHFPESAEVPESKTHLELRTLLYLFLKRAFAADAAIGCDQFVYWNPRDPAACLAPDAFVRLGVRDDRFRSWKVWERGAPQVCVEIVSESDSPAWDVKLERYSQLGVSELVWFDSEALDRPLRVWDLVAGELVERELSGRHALSKYLGGYWLAVDVPGEGLTLRLAHDALGLRLFPTPEEAEAAARAVEAEARAIEAEARSAEAEARVAAERRAEAAERELAMLRSRG